MLSVRLKTFFFFKHSTGKQEISPQHKLQSWSSEC